MSRNNNLKLLNCLNDVRDDFIHEAQHGAQKDLVTKNTIKKRSKRLTIAACLSFLLLSITIFASTEWGITLIDKYTSRKELGSDYSESGYSISVNIEKKSMNNFNGDIQQVPKLIIKQFKHDDPHSSWYPGDWQTSFTSSDEAINFIGLKELSRLNWPLDEEGTILNVHGNKSGEILSVTLETDYVLDNIRVQAFSNIYTEETDGPIDISSITTENVKFEGTYYKSPNQILCYIVTSSAQESGYYGLDGYLVQDGILYNISIAYLEDDKHKANELLYMWADSF